MDERQTIEEKLRKKESEIHTLEERLKSARIYVQALQDILRSLDKKVCGSGNSATALREGSAVARARDIILARGGAVHINNILEDMGKDTDRDSRSSLTSSLSAYVRRGEIFTRPAPNTFGLAELGHQTFDDVDVEPPKNFGAVEPPPPRAPPARRPAAEDDDIPF